jgi:hypothetical protein
MRSLALLATIVAISPFAHAQSGSGAPSPVGQTPTPQAIAAAERAVQARHEKVAAFSAARAARRAEKAASANDR